MQRRALMLGLGALAACAKPRPAPPPAPAVTSASEMIPPDLDVVARFDWARMKGALGGLALSALSKQILAHDGAENEADRLVVTSLLSADQVYLGYRPTPLLLPLDRVLALQGHFEPLTRAPAGFSGAIDVGGDVRYWDRAPSASPERGSVARVYAYGERVRAFVSEAELDAVERLLSGAEAERRLAPPEEGTFSLAARSRLLAPLVGRGSLREMLEDAGPLQAVIDLDSDAVQLQVELVLASAERAQSLARAGRHVLARSAARLSPEAVLRAEGGRLVLSARLRHAELAPLLSCLRDASDPSCAW